MFDKTPAADLQRLNEKLGNIESGLENASRRRGRESYKEATKQAVESEMDTNVLRDAQTVAKRFVGSERAQTIDTHSSRWSSNTYEAGLGSEDPVVLYHEEGTGTYGGGGAYEIKPNVADKLAFRVGGKPIFADVVVHPGVRGKSFMEKAVRRNADQINEEVADSVAESMSRAMDPHSR